MSIQVLLFHAGSASASEADVWAELEEDVNRHLREIGAGREHLASLSLTSAIAADAEGVTWFEAGLALVLDVPGTREEEPAKDEPASNSGLNSLPVTPGQITEIRSLGRELHLLRSNGSPTPGWQTFLKPFNVGRVDELTSAQAQRLLARLRELKTKRRSQQ